VSLQKQYVKFHNTIKLSRESEAYRDAREKDDSIYKKIKDAFKDEGYEIIRSKILGSMGVHTGIEPLDEDHDIDRGVFITKESSPDNPVDIKKVVKKVLTDHGFKESKIKKPCVTADYKSKPIHIDYVVFREDFNRDVELAVGKEHSNEDNRKWDSSDPEGLSDWLTWKDEQKTSAQREQYYRLVRYLKRWRDHKYSSNKSDRKKVYSIGLAIMLRESMKFSIDTSGVADDNQALIDTITNILDGNYFSLQVIPLLSGIYKYDICVNLPKSPYRDVFNDHGEKIGTTLRNRLNSLLSALKEIRDEDDLNKQCEKLRSEFGDDFNLPDKIEQAKAKGPGVLGISSGA